MLRRKALHEQWVRTSLNRRCTNSQLSSPAGMALSVDTTDKIAVNGVDLVNRHELSPYQEKELQRYIDENAHILSWKDREKLEPFRRPMSTGSNYSSLSRDLNRGESPFRSYQSMERKKSSEPVYTEIGKSNVNFVPPNIEHHNYTTDFPGMEYLTDNSFLLQFGGKIPAIATNRPISAMSNYCAGGFADTSRQSSVMPTYDASTERYRSQSHAGTTSVNPYAYSSSTVPRGGLARPTSAMANPYGTMKSRKGVSWLDQERARSLSPTHNKSQNLMSHYGSSGNVGNVRDQTASPAYSALGRHQDNYNRFETARHAAHSDRHKSPFEDSRFGGFGDRPGSGVELTQHSWQGGEIINDPNQVPKGLQPRRIYYSPIGDGTVAADGYELKRRPVDLSPRVTITQLQHVDRGEKGRDGVNIYEKSWTNTMGSAPSEGGYGSEYGPGSGRNSRAGALSPASGLGGPTGLGDKGGAGRPANGSPYGGRGGPGGAGAGGPGGAGGAGGDPFGTGAPNAGLGNRDPYGTMDSRGSNPYGSNGNLGPQDGRASAASSMFSDPAYRFDTKTGYLITNPRELIHQYATTTPVAIMDNQDNTSATTTITKQSMYRRTEETTEERFAPYAPYKAHTPVASPNKFVKQLRDETMTSTQREANTHLDPVNKRDPNAREKIHQIQSKTTVTRGGRDDIDSLTQQLMSGLATTTPVQNRYV